jgi:hypothetical protein
MAEKIAAAAEAEKAAVEKAAVQKAAAEEKRAAVKAAEALAEEKLAKAAEIEAKQKSAAVAKKVEETGVTEADTEGKVSNTKITEEKDAGETAGERAGGDVVAADLLSPRRTTIANPNQEDLMSPRGVSFILPEGDAGPTPDISFGAGEEGDEEEAVDVAGATKATPGRVEGVGAYGATPSRIVDRTMHMGDLLGSELGSNRGSDKGSEIGSEKSSERGDEVDAVPRRQKGLGDTTFHTDRGEERSQSRQSGASKHSSQPSQGSGAETDPEMSGFDESDGDHQEKGGPAPLPSASSPQLEEGHEEVKEEIEVDGLVEHDTEDVFHDGVVVTGGSKNASMENKVAEKTAEKEELAEEDETSQRRAHSDESLGDLLGDSMDLDLEDDEEEKKPAQKTEPAAKLTAARNQPKTLVPPKTSQESMDLIGYDSYHHLLLLFSAHTHPAHRFLRFGFRHHDSGITIESSCTP